MYLFYLGIPPHFVVLVGQMFVRGGEEVEGAHLSLQPSVLLQTAPRGQGPGPARDLDNLADICLMLTAPRERLPLHNERLRVYSLFDTHKISFS